MGYFHLFSIAMWNTPRDPEPAENWTNRAQCAILSRNSSKPHGGFLKSGYLQTIHLNTFSHYERSPFMKWNPPYYANYPLVWYGQSIVNHSFPNEIEHLMVSPSLKQTHLFYRFIFGSPGFLGSWSLLDRGVWSSWKRTRRWRRVFIAVWLTSASTLFWAPPGTGRIMFVGSDRVKHRAKVRWCWCEQGWRHQQHSALSTLLIVWCYINLPAGGDQKVNWALLPCWTTGPVRLRKSPKDNSQIRPHHFHYVDGTCESEYRTQPFIDVFTPVVETPCQINVLAVEITTSCLDAHFIQCWTEGSSHKSWPICFGILRFFRISLNHSHPNHVFSLGFP